jgi:hypothetical protein
MSIYRRLLRLAAYVNFAIAGAHLLIPLAVEPIGPLRKPAWAQGVVLYLAVAGVAAGVTLLGLYSLSGGGRIRRLPFLRTVLLLASVVFLADLVDMARVTVSRGGWEALARPSPVPFLLLAMGLLYLVATIGLWKELRPAGRTDP